MLRRRIYVMVGRPPVPCLLYQVDLIHQPCVTAPDYLKEVEGDVVPVIKMVMERVVMVVHVKGGTASNVKACIDLI